MIASVYGLVLGIGGAVTALGELLDAAIRGADAMSIAGGASNIQRNIIAERGLGLPRDALV